MILVATLTPGMGGGRLTSTELVSIGMRRSIVASSPVEVR